MAGCRILPASKCRAGGDSGSGKWGADHSIAEAQESAGQKYSDDNPFSTFDITLPIPIQFVPLAIPPHAQRTARTVQGSQRTPPLRKGGGKAAGYPPAYPLRVK